MSSDTRSAQRTAIRLVLRHYFAQLRRDRRIAIPALLLPGIGNVLVLYAPAFVLGKMITRFESSPRPTLDEMLPYLVALFGAWIAGELLWRAAIFCLNRTDLRGMGRLYVNGMRELLQKDLAFFHDNFAGALTKKSIAYAKMYEGFVDTISFSIIGALLPLAFVVVVLWRYSPWLILTLVGLMALTLFLILPLIKRRQKLVDEREKASNVLAGHIADSISNVDAVRAFAREGFELVVHERNVNDYMRKTLRSWDYQNFPVDSITSPLYVLTNVIGLVVAIMLSRGGTFSIEAVFVTFSFYAQFTRVMWEFSRIYRGLETIMTEAAQFTILLVEPPAVLDPAAPEPFRPTGSSVEVRDITFRYSGKAVADLFRGFSLAVGSGEKVGLVGRSGGGKSSLTRLLLRFMDVQEGSIRIGGHDVAKITQADLREMISYVPQDPVMFHRTVADNIRFGRLDATDDDVREAARLAHAAEFIESLPNGYETLIGERGIKLSGGQRQRVAIARAILKNAPILVLDEATSSLDSESERLIQDALWTLLEDRTAIVIAHRLSTVRRMDRLVVIEHGAIVEQGSHEQLLASAGTYATLWEHQSGGFLAEEAEPATV